MRASFQRRCVCLALFGLLIAGCDNSPRFEADAIALAEQRIVPDHREQIEVVLQTLLGTPDEPLAPASLAGLFDQAKLAQSAGPVTSHKVGETTTGLFRRHCARCHGVTGNGRGPAALHQDPYPRDFRRGLFKFKSTARGAPPTDADLHAVLERGVAGAAMPSFQLLQPAERESLVQYIRYLAIRGQMETALINYVADELDFDPDAGTANEHLVANQTVIDQLLAEVAQPWREAEDRVIVAAAPPLDDAQRIAAGRALYHDAKRANCAKCHGEDGQGAAIADFDDWNKRRHEFADATQRLAATAATLGERLAQSTGAGQDQLRTELLALARQVDQRRDVAAALLPAMSAMPRRLAGGVLRGGGEPIDLYRVIHQGIAGTPMPGVADALSEDEVWNLVAYVRSLTGGGTDD